MASSAACGWSGEGGPGASSGEARGGGGGGEARAAAARVCPRGVVVERTVYTGMLDTARALWREEGARAFCRGVTARMLIHAPSVAICWTTYETVKHWMVRNSWLGGA